MSRNIFISGSISINKLPRQAILELDNIIGKGMKVLIGDANGVDLQVQKYLREKNYSNVIIYHVGKEARNNAGFWETKSITTNFSARGRLLYTEKDKAMVADTYCGLMIWDGKSKGTLSNIKAMLAVQKGFCVILNEELITSDQVDTILHTKEIKRKDFQLALF
jgi:hypothetical protein